MMLLLPMMLPPLLLPRLSSNMLNRQLSSAKPRRKTEPAILFFPRLANFLWHERRSLCVCVCVCVREAHTHTHASRHHRIAALRAFHHVIAPQTNAGDTSAPARSPHSMGGLLNSLYLSLAHCLALYLLLSLSVSLR